MTLDTRPCDFPSCNRKSRGSGNEATILPGDWIANQLTVLLIDAEAIGPTVCCHGDRRRRESNVYIHVFTHRYIILLQEITQRIVLVYIYMFIPRPSHTAFFCSLQSTTAKKSCVGRPGYEASEYEHCYKQLLIALVPRPPPILWSLAVAWETGARSLRVPVRDPARGVETVHTTSPPHQPSPSSSSYYH